MAVRVQGFPNAAVFSGTVSDLLVPAVSRKNRAITELHMITPIFLFSVGMVLFCFYMARHAVQGYQRAKASLHWPTASGVLTDVRLWGTRNIDGEMIESEKLRVAYQYAIGGVPYSGSEVAFYQLHYPETMDFAKCHPTGSHVKVFYNPKNVSESVLISGAHPAKPYGGLVLALASVFVSVVVSVAAWLGVLA